MVSLKAERPSILCFSGGGGGGGVLMEVRSAGRGEERFRGGEVCVGKW